LINKYSIQKSINVGAKALKKKLSRKSETVNIFITI